MCRNGNQIQQNKQNRQEINVLPENNMGPVNLQGQQEDKSFLGGMVGINLEGKEIKAGELKGIPKVEHNELIQQHVNGLKEEQRILQEAREEYSPYNVQGQYIKFIKPRVKGRAPIQDVHMIEPSYGYMAKAYTMTGFPLTDSVEKRSKLLSESRERRGLQQKFADKINYVNQHPVTKVRNVSIKDVMDLSDEKLVANYGTYAGDGKELLDIRYNLMKNPLYSILPVKELKKTPRQELLKKLDEEYSHYDANRGAVISLYEDLLRLQVLEKNAKSVERKNPKNPPVNITDKERKDNKTTRVNITNELNKSKHLSKEEIIERRITAEKVLDSFTYKFWEEKSEADLDGVSAEQKEGVRMILAWMYRNCGAGKADTKEPFIYELTKAKPKQLLFMLYIVENGLAAAPSAECFSDALKNYIPNPKAAAFKNKPDWTAISQAAGFVYDCGEFNAFLSCEKEQKSLSDDLLKNVDVHNEKKIEDTGRLVIVIANKLSALYNAAGLAPDMSVNLIADKTLKEHILSTVRDFEAALVLLQDEISVQHPEIDAGKEIEKMLKGENGEGNPIQDDKSLHLNNKKTELSSERNKDEKVRYAKAGVSIPKNTFKVIGSSTKVFTKTLQYSIVTNGIGFLFAIYDLYRKVPELAKLFNSIRKGTNVLSLAETASKNLALTGGTIKGGADIVGGITDIYKYANHLDKKQYASFADKMASTPEAIQFGTGVISIVAGGLQTISAGIDLKETSYSRKHLKKAEQHLDDNSAEDLQQVFSDEEERKRMLQRKELTALIKHRKNMTENARSSATISMTGGILTMIGGTLSVTGVLAPLGGILGIAGSVINIGLGIIHARAKRNKSIKDAVDEGLKLDKVFIEVGAHFKLTQLKPEEYEALKDGIRQEALAELHYATYKACYIDMCKKSAGLLYNKVMVKPSDREWDEYEETSEYKMYYETLLSLGFKEVKKAKYPFQRNFPTAELIFDKLAKGVA